MQAQWFKFCKTAEQRAEVESLVSGATPTLKLLERILESRLSELETTNVEDYESPSWSHKQADRIGSIREIKTLLKLIKGSTPNDK